MIFDNDDNDFNLDDIETDDYEDDTGESYNEEDWQNYEIEVELEETLH